MKKKTAKKLSINRETLINLGRYQVSWWCLQRLLRSAEPRLLRQLRFLHPTISGHCITTTDGHSELT